MSVKHAPERATQVRILVPAQKENFSMSKSKRRILVIAAEVFVPMFLLYANILMGYYTRSGISKELTIQEIVTDIATPEMFLIASVGGFVAFITLEFLRRKIQKYKNTP